MFYFLRRAMYVINFRELTRGLSTLDGTAFPHP